MVSKPKNGHRQEPDGHAGGTNDDDGRSQDRE